MGGRKYLEIPWTGGVTNKFLKFIPSGSSDDYEIYAETFVSSSAKNYGLFGHGQAVDQTGFGPVEYAGNLYWSGGPAHQVIQVVGGTYTMLNEEPATVDTSETIHFRGRMTSNVLKSKI